MLASRVAKLCALLLCAVAIGGFIGCGSGSGSGTPSAPASPTASVAPVTPPIAAQPEVAIPVAPPVKSAGEMHQVTLKDLDGKDVALAQYAGRPMIIEIWATWCGPCIKNRASFHAAKKDVPERVVLLAASADTTSDLVKNFLKTHDSTGRELMATPSLYAAIKGHDPGNTIPKTVYVDSKGHVIDVAQGIQSVTWIKAMSKNLR